MAADEEDVSQIMGFSAFGNKKKAAKQFDFMAILEEAKKVARERNNATESGSKANATSQSAGKLKGPMGPPGMLPAADADDDDDDDNLVGPVPPVAAVAHCPNPADSEDEDEEEEDEADSEENQLLRDLFVPCGYEICLEAGSKPITAMGLDSSGARVFTGGLDFDVKLWDFAGMDASHRCFKTVRPMEAHQIKALDFNLGGDQVLVCSGSATAKVLDRDGRDICQTVKGYQYISNPASAAGHTHMLNGGMWNPRVREEFLTCSNDGTLRTWNVSQVENFLNEWRLTKHSNCVKTKSRDGRRVVPTTCRYSRDAGLLAAGCQDGSLQMWDTRGMLVNTAMMLRGAHAPDSHITSMDVSFDSQQLLTRGMDDSLRLWDLRAFKSPVHLIDGLPNLFEQTQCGFSPNDKLLYTGVSKQRHSAQGEFKVYRRDTGEEVHSLATDHGSVIRCVWHPRLNQLLLGCADGSVTVYYDLERSVNGAKLAAFKSRRKASYVGVFAKQSLLTYDEETERAARRGQRRSKYNEVAGAATANKNYKPQPPVNGPSSQGRMKASGSTMHQFMIQQVVLGKKEAPRDSDIRGAILRHAADATANPVYTNAYHKTQPDPCLAPAIDGEEALPGDANEKRDSQPLWKKPKLS